MIWVGALFEFFTNMYIFIILYIYIYPRMDSIIILPGGSSNRLQGKVEWYPACLTEISWEFSGFHTRWVPTKL